MLDWDDLRFVLAVACGGSLSAAARTLAVEHSTVGRRLTSIESSLGVRLFDRTSGGHVPTGAGAAAIAHARAVEDHMLALEREVAGTDQRVSGTVRITALDAFVNDFLIPHLAELDARHPELQVIAIPEARMVSLAHLEADIAIRWSSPDDRNYSAQKLADIGSGIYASRPYIERRGHPATPGELAAHERVAYAPELAHASEERWFVDHAPLTRIALRAGSPTAYRTAIEEGLGVGIYECHSAERAGLVRLWREPVLIEQWWTVVHADIARAARIRATLAFLSDLAQTNRDALAGSLPPAPTLKHEPRRAARSR